MTPLFDTITLSMIKRLTLCLLLTCLYVPCFSQERFVVRGRILDAESAPVPYCSVSILESRDSTILGGAVSDTKGRYSLHFEQAGRYLHLAYESCYRTVEVPEAQTLPDVILRPAADISTRWSWWPEIPNTGQAATKSICWVIRSSATGP